MQTHAAFASGSGFANLKFRAAIEAGADAAYFGLTHFSARAKVGFTLTELPEVMRTLHQRGVKGYITFLENQGARNYVDHPF